LLLRGLLASQSRTVTRDVAAGTGAVCVPP
jgi:hypothetical protein